MGIFNQDLEGLAGQFQLVMNHLFSWDLLIARANGQVLFFSFGREGPLWKQINVSRSSVAPSDRVGSCRVVRGQRRGGIGVLEVVDDDQGDKRVRNRRRGPRGRGEGRVL